MYLTVLMICNITQIWHQPVFYCEQRITAFNLLKYLGGKWEGRIMKLYIKEKVFSWGDSYASVLKENDISLKVISSCTEYPSSRKRFA